jgi:signal transduction histidine kinase
MGGPMEKLETKQNLKKERQKTDQNLFSERDKTNRSVDQKIENTENQTDEKVRKIRAESDEINHADSAIKRERIKSDLALEEERETKNTFTKQTIDKERKKTDRNLSVERIRADSEVEHSSELFLKEALEHSKTKILLTTRDEFLAIVSHDLRSPIGVAYSYASLLLDDAARCGMDSEIREGLEAIKRSANTSLRLISDLLDMERVAQGKLHLTQKMNTVEQILQESVDCFAHTALNRKITLSIAPIDTSIQAYCDRDRVLQVLSNIIDNGLKFTPDGANISLGAKMATKEILFFVCDAGVGIPKERHHSIFERFTQIASTDRSSLGLGLYISKMLIEAHRGRIWVESSVGKGSTFWFSIPRIMHC